MSSGKRTALLLATLAVAVAGPLAWSRRPAETAPPYGIAERVPWTTSRITGSPEPPPPYQTERIYPRLKFTNPLDVAYAPGCDRLFVMVGLAESAIRR